MFVCPSDPDLCIWAILGKKIGIRIQGFFYSLLLNKMSSSSETWVAPGEMYEGTHFVVKGLPTTNGSTVAREILVCFHGIKAYHTCFNRLADYILRGAPNRYVIIQIDEIGRGFSEPSRNGKYTENEYIPMIHSLLNYLRTTYLPASGVSAGSNLKFHLLGHSFGGCLASLFASVSPNLVKSLTLLAPAGLMNFIPFGLIQTAPAIRFLTKLKLQKRENQIQSWRDDFYSHEGEALELENEQVRDLTLMYDNNPHAFPSFWGTFTTFPLIDISKSLKVLKDIEDFPIYLLWGDKDEAVPFATSYPKWIKFFDTTTNKCRFETKVYPNAKHGFFLEYHSVVNADILQFLNSTIA